MDKVQFRYLIIIGAGLSLAGAREGGALAQKFYPDDPIWKSPAPLPVKDPAKRKINQLYDFAINTGATPGEKQNPEAPIIAKDINTIGEVPDDLFYTNRHRARRMTIEELKIGAWRNHQPVGPFQVVGSKTEGITPGFQIRDSRGRRYLCKPDPRTNPEMATAADVVTSKFMYALGYNVPENYILRFRGSELSIDPKAKVTPPGGRERAMNEDDLARVLDRMPRDREDGYRVMASFFIEGQGIGPFKWYGRRTDDPNDIWVHEHRRSLRGLHVFAAWLNHTDAKAGNTYDTVQTVDGVPAIRHYLIDFGASLGSDSDEAKNARFGHEYMIEKDKKILLKMFDLGLYSPAWERADYGDIKSVGRFESTAFDPDNWKTNYPNSAFINRLPDDTFWAAKQVMTFTEPEIRAIVETGEYSDRRAVDYISKVLMDFLNRRAFENFNAKTQREIRAQIVKFLDGICGPGKLIEKFKILRFEQDPVQKDRIYLDIHMTPYFPAKNYVFKLDGQKGDDPDSAEWQSEYAQE